MMVVKDRKRNYRERCKLTFTQELLLHESVFIYRMRLGSMTVNLLSKVKIMWNFLILFIRDCMLLWKNLHQFSSPYNLEKTLTHFNNSDSCFNVIPNVSNSIIEDSCHYGNRSKHPIDNNYDSPIIKCNYILIQQHLK